MGIDLPLQETISFSSNLLPFLKNALSFLSLLIFLTHFKETISKPTPHSLNVEPCYLPRLFACSAHKEFLEYYCIAIGTLKGHIWRLHTKPSAAFLNSHSRRLLSMSIPIYGLGNQRVHLLLHGEPYVLTKIAPFDWSDSKSYVCSCFDQDCFFSIIMHLWFF